MTIIMTQQVVSITVSDRDEGYKELSIASKDHYRLSPEQAVALAKALGVTREPEEDGRIEAWGKLADHPFFKSCYNQNTSLLSAMITKLDARHEQQPAFDAVEYSKALEVKLTSANVELRASRDAINVMRNKLGDSDRENVQKYHEIQELKQRVENQAESIGNFYEADRVRKAKKKAKKKANRLDPEPFVGLSSGNRYSVPQAANKNVIFDPRRGYGTNLKEYKVNPSTTIYPAKPM